MLFVIGVEQRQLLRAMSDVLSVVDVEDDLLGRLRVGGQEGVQQGARQAVEIGAADLILQTRQRRLTGQIRARSRRPLTGGFQRRITAQLVAVVGVLVAAGNLKDALAQKVLVRVVDVAGMPPVTQGGHHALDDTHDGFGRSQQQHTAVLGKAAAVEIGFDFFARNPCEGQGVMRVFHRGVLSKWFVVLYTPNLGKNNHLCRGHRLFYE